MHARGDPVSELFEPARRGTESAYRLARFRTQRFDALPCGGQAQQRYVRRLALHRVLARGLAQTLRRAFDVEDVVDDLEGQPDGRGITEECIVAVGIHRLAAIRAEANRRPDERTCFESMHALEFMELERRIERGEIDGLSTRHP